MKTVTNKYKQELVKLGREIDLKFFLHTNDKILTEDSKFLMTQDNTHLVVEQFDDEEVDETITADDIYAVSIVNRGEILSTMMKELDFEVSKDLRIGDVIGCQFGLKVDGSYEYIDYGKYMIYEKEFNEDTKTYNYIAYDRMLLTMQTTDQEFLDDLEGRTLANTINWICGRVGLSYTATPQELEDYPNLLKEINEGTFTGMQITYRDILDMICQALGLSMIVEGSYLRLKPLNDTPVDTINEQYLKDTNVSFGKKYGPVNSIVLSRSEDNDTIYRRDEESIADNGLCEYKIKDNLIMLYDDREDYIDEIFEQLNGLEYYPTDINSIGITYLDWLDFYNVTVGDKTYKCLMLDDEIEIDQGLEELIYSEEPIETVTNYKTSSKTDKEVSFIVDKQNGRISSKVSQNDIIASLNIAIEDGQGVINLKGNTVTIEADNFKLDRTGKVVADDITVNNGTFKGSINTAEDCTIGNNLYVGQSQLSTIEYERYIKMTENTYLRRYRNTSYPQPYEILDLTSNVIQLKTTNSVNSREATPFFSYGYTTTMRTESQYITMDNSTISASSQIQVGSDERLKQNINDMDVSWIDDLKVKEFEYINNPDKKQIGLIAQDYEDKEYSKYFLGTDREGYYGIVYGNITNALIQYCQEMKKEINSLKKEIKKLKESDK